MQDEAKPVLLCSHPSPSNGSPKLNLGVNICDSDSLAISLSLPISELSCSSCSSSSSSSLSPLGGLTPLLTNPLTLSTSPSLWSSSSSSANSNVDLANHAHSPRSGPASPANFLLPGVVNANKSPWANGSLSPQTGGGALWNRGRSAPNLTNNLLGHAPFSPFSASHSSAWSGFGSTSPAPTNRKPAPLYGNNTPTSGFLAPGQGGGRFRRSTSYPGKNNIFGAVTNQIPTFEVTNIDEGNDYIYQDPYAGNLGSGGPLDNMRSLDYVLQEILPQHENDIFKAGKNYYGGLEGSPGDMGFPEDPSALHHLANLGGLGGMHPEGFGMSAGLNYLSSMASPSRHSPSRLSPRSPASNAGSDGGERYSRKVFVGGLPPDIDEEEINASFRRFGALVVDWPHKAESKSYFPPKGYAFLLFQEESSVQRLIEACMQEDDKLYLYVSSPTIKDKAVQIRPWKLSDADFVLDASLPLDPRKTVFVGGVPRPLKAVELALIMDRLYGGVCYAGIDIDPELKYPKGAGRVAFSNQQSYIAAISARFVQLQHGDIDKRVEVKPYVLDDQFCDECQGTRSAGRFAPFFCANITCLQYYCENCWAVVHSHPGREFHKPLVKEGADRPRTVHFRW